MVGRPRVPSEDPVTTSPTRTYVLVVYDVVCPNEARFEKMVLPESWKNTSLEAEYYYRSQNQDRAQRILACVAFEDYINTVADVVQDVIFEKPKYKPKISYRSFATGSSNSLAEDMKEVRQMLDAWNDEQEHASTTYAMILRSILQLLQLKEKTMAEIKELVLY